MITRNIFPTNKNEDALNPNEIHSLGMPARPDNIQNELEYKRTDLSEVKEQNLKEKRPPPFAPFYTLINTAETIAHPKQVHYLFSDDDASEVLTAALLQSSCGESSLCMSYNNSSDIERSGNKALAVSDSSSRQSASSKKEKLTRGKLLNCEERVIIVDLNATGDAIENANSLSPNWQILNAQIVKAPTWSGAESNAGSPNGIPVNMMLKIEGVAYNDFNITAIPTRKIGSDMNTLAEEEEMQCLLEQFNQKMAVLRRVMGTGSPLKHEDKVMQPNNNLKFEQD